MNVNLSKLTQTQKLKIKIWNTIFFSTEWLN